jgi:hypothetical protein
LEKAEREKRKEASTAKQIFNLTLGAQQSESRDFPHPAVRCCFFILNIVCKLLLTSINQHTPAEIKGGARACYIIHEAQSIKQQRADEMREILSFAQIVLSALLGGWKDRRRGARGGGGVRVKRVVVLPMPVPAWVLRVRDKSREERTLLV